MAPGLKPFHVLSITAVGLLFLTSQLIPDHLSDGLLFPAAHAKNGKGGDKGGGGAGNGNSGGRGNGKSASHGKGDGHGNGKANGRADTSPGAARSNGKRGSQTPAAAAKPLAAIASLFNPQFARTRQPRQLRHRPAQFAAGSGLGTARRSAGAGRVVASLRTSTNPRAVVAAGLSQADIDRLSSKGLRVVARSSAIEPAVVKFALPRRVASAEARRWITEVNSRAASDVDAFYYPDEGPERCAGAACALSLIKWPASPACRTTMTIGMIDTGVDLEHEALKGQDIEVVDVISTPSAADQEHGTAVAALLVGKSDADVPGLVPDAKLVAVNAFAVHDGEERADVVRITAALDALRQRGVKVVNLSFSGPPNEVLKRAIDGALADGMTLVAAAGNGGPGASPSYPAAYPGVLAVTAVDANMRIYKRATRGEYVELSAPGVDIRTAAAGGGVAIRSGTSFAAPFVTAAVGRLRAGSLNGEPNQAQQRLIAAARDLGSPGRDAVFGWGLVQVGSLCGADETDVAGGTKTEVPASLRE